MPLLSRTGAAATAGLLGLAVVGLSNAAPWDPAYFSWGLFRHRKSPDVTFEAIDRLAQQMIRDEHRRVIFSDDDPTASVAVL